MTYTAYISDHYELDSREEEFGSLEDALNAVERARDDGGDGYVVDEDGVEYDY